ncbi:MAG: hypothetical protein ABEN55_20210, partial [Bradymonadaceae bacterium]
NEIKVEAPLEWGESATVKVVVDDGQGASSESVAVVQTEKNSAPTIDSLTATPNPVLQNSESTLEVKASDAESGKQTLSYSWSLDNQKWSKTENGSTMALKAPQEGNSSVTVTVTVDD